MHLFSKHRPSNTMTRKATTGPSLARKITPTASKTWKENLHRACLDRARRERTEKSVNRDNRANDDHGVFLSARFMVEDELVQRAISVQSPCSDGGHLWDAANQTPAGLMDSSRKVDPFSNHFITEDELFELLAEVEQEIEREDALHLDEMIEIALHERDYLQDQVMDFERWEESKQQNEEIDSAMTVLCPICHDANLIQSTGRSIVCPNRMDGSCSMNLDNVTIVLSELQEKISMAFEQHSFNCNNCLSFQIQEGHLRAICPDCVNVLEII